MKATRVSLVINRVLKSCLNFSENEPGREVKGQLIGVRECPRLTLRILTQGLNDCQHLVRLFYQGICWFLSLRG